MTGGIVEAAVHADVTSAAGLPVLHFDFYGIGVSVTTDDPFVHENIQRDFVLFARPVAPSKPHLRLTVRRGVPSYDQLPPLTASLYTASAVCYRTARRHFVDYGGQALLVVDFHEATADLVGVDPMLLYEKAGLAMLSRVGELWDRQGFHRVHAMGIAKHGKAVLCIMPMGGGKTTLALQVLKQDPDVELLSDDMCIVRRGLVYPFVAHVGVRQRSALADVPEHHIRQMRRQLYGTKYLVDPSYLAERVASPTRITGIIIGRRVTSSSSGIQPISKVRALRPLLESGVLGLGLPQILEMFFRLGTVDLLRKMRLLVLRTVACVGWLGSSRVYEMKVGRDAQLNAEALIRLLSE